MSSRAENWAWERDDVKGITKFVLVYLARRAYYDDGAAAWPSVETIAFNCGCCERTVIRSLQELERKGYIRPGDQEMSARNPRTRKPIAKGHRSRVWDVVMDGDHPAENIEEKPRNLDALAEGDGKPESDEGQFVTRRIVTRAEGRGDEDKLSRNLGQKVTQ